MEIKGIFKKFTSKSLTNYLVIFGVEFLIMLIGILLFKIVAIKFSEIGFAEFSINKRLVGFLVPLIMMGMGVSLPKFLPIENPDVQLRIHYAALSIISGLFLICIILFVSFSNTISQAIFGDFYHKKLCLASLIYVYSLMFHACIYNYFRGKFKFFLSSMIQLVNLGLLPLIVYFFSDSILQYLSFLGTSTILLLIVLNASLIPTKQFSWKEIWPMINKLCKYGIKRMPGDVILGLLLAIPAFFVSNYFSIKLGGIIAFCLSLFNIVIALMSPVNIILLPQASKIINEKNYNLLNEVAKKLFYVSLALGLVSMLFVFIFGNWILNLFSISTETNAATYLSIIFSGIIGFSIFSVIRSIIDAYYDKARVTSIIVIAFMTFLLAIAFLKLFHIFTIVNLLVAFSIAINVMGLLTFISLLFITRNKHS